MTVSEILPCLEHGVGYHRLGSMASKQGRVVIVSTVPDTWRKGGMEP